MSKTIAIDRSREIGLGYLYWLTFLIALKPDDILHGMEAARIATASLLGALSAPLVLALIRRFPIQQGPSLSRHLAIHGASASGIAFCLIAVSCLLAPMFQVGDTRPFLVALPLHLAANWMLLAFCVLAFAAIAQAAGVLRRREAAASAELPTLPFVQSLTVKTTGRTVEVAIGDIDWIETQGNYLALRVGETTHLIRETLTALEARLAPTSFVRIHRRMLVSLDRVCDVTPAGNGDATVVLANGTRLRVSRNYRERLRDALAERAASI
jgi:two-component system, LytTR family, response regulator